MLLRTDTYRHKGMRKKLIDIVRKKGIEDERLLDAMERLPRHLFLDEAFVAFAYEDTAFKIGEGQTISQPFTVAYQTELLQVKRGDKILEIGTGSGYQAAVLVEMGATVYTIERIKSLSDSARKLLRTLGYKQVRCSFGDGFEGLPAFAPYDGILITCAAPEIPETLKEQLAIGGRLVVPLGKGEVQLMVRLTRLPDDDFQTDKFDQFRFVPMLEGKVEKPIKQ